MVSEQKPGNFRRSLERANFAAKRMLLLLFHSGIHYIIWNCFHSNSCSMNNLFVHKAANIYTYKCIAMI